MARGQHASVDVTLYIQMERDPQYDPCDWFFLDDVECDDKYRAWVDRSINVMGLFDFLFVGLTDEEIVAELAPYADDARVKIVGTLSGGWSGYETPEYDESFEWRFAPQEEP